MYKYRELLAHFACCRYAYCEHFVTPIGHSAPLWEKVTADIPNWRNSSLFSSKQQQIHIHHMLFTI